MGKLGAIDTSSAKCRKPRYVVLPEHLEAFEQDRKACPNKPPTPRRRRPRGEFTDFYPNYPD
jgi:hypothetical protein